ncbi:MAG: NAD-dependent epimerase/dehydratase family protein [Halobacteriaceae archaeon]
MTALVVGCGYVGSELARTLVADGDDVIAVSRSGVAIEGVESLERDVTDSDLDLPPADRVFYLVGAGSRDVDAYRAAYVDGLEHTVTACPDADLVYASSTGVYDVADGSWVDEETAPDRDAERSRVLLDAEDVARDAGGTVVRLSGLYGPGRLVGDRYLDGARVPAGYLNLLHRDDAASALRAAADGDRDLYLAVDDEPVHRHDLSRWLAEFTGRDPGELVDAVERSNKRCSNERLRGTGWEPAYPTYREGYAAILGQ